MSFEKKNIWMPRDKGFPPSGEMGYGSSSRVAPKRAHQSFLDASEPELFSNKKQAIEAVTSRPTSGISNADISFWEYAPSFRSASGQLTDRLFGSDALRTSNLSGRNIPYPSISTGNSNMENKGFDDQFGNNSSVGLSVPPAMEDPLSSLNYTGIRKVKINQVSENDNEMSASLGRLYRGNNNTISQGPTYNNTDNNITLAPSYNNGVESTISMDTNFNRTDGKFVSTGHTFNKGDGTFMLMGHNYGKVGNSILAAGRPFDSGDGNFISANQRYEKDDRNTISTAPAYNNGHDNFVSMSSVFNKANENFVPMGLTYDKEDQNIISVGPNHDKENKSFVSTNTISTAPVYDEGRYDFILRSSSYNKANESFIPMPPSYDKEDQRVISVGQNNEKENTTFVASNAAFDKGDAAILSVGQNYNNGETGTGTVLFGGLQDETGTSTYGSIINGYNVLMSQPSGQTSNAPVLEGSIERIADPIVSVAPEATVKKDSVPRKKEQKVTKQASPNNFPSNVKSLLSTGMLDGVPVKYVSWTREKNLRGIIKGTGYLCDCNDCKLSKALNAYEFERHAGCKTKHPNNHVYFENGKTVYAVVQELKNTPQEMLFETIQNVTGSPIHQKNFIAWKASYEAATRELQRIYGRAR